MNWPYLLNLMSAVLQMMKKKTLQYEEDSKIIYKDVFELKSEKLCESLFHLFLII
jgi:hypothetical protein